MKKLKSITHCVIAIAITMTSMNLGVFGALTTYANELTVGNDSYHPIKPMEELLTEEPINLVSPTIESVLTQNIRERMLKLNQPETEVEEAEVELQPETEVEELDVVPQPETEVEEAEVELQPETEVEEADVDSQPETEVEEADVALQPETEVEESDVALQPETEVEEADVEPQPETEVEEADVEPQPETEVEESDVVLQPETEVEESEFESFTIANIQEPILVKGDYNQLFFDFNTAWFSVTNVSNVDNAQLTFLKDYTIKSSDVSNLTRAFNVDHVTITALDGVTVTVETDLEFYRGYYSTDSVNRKSITFENITFKFTDEHKIIANGLWLHMGQGVNMLGDKFPKILLGSIQPLNDTINGVPSPNWQIAGRVYLFIESGTYSEVIVGSESIGRLLEERSETYLFGGTVKKLSYGQNNTVKMDHYVHVMGGQVFSVEDEGKGVLPDRFGIKVFITTTDTQTIDNYINILDLQIGDYTINGVQPGKVKITGKLTFKQGGTIGVYSGSTLTIDEKAEPITLFYGWMEEGCTLELPANRNKNQVPLTFETSFYVPQNTHLKISNKMTTDEFYLIKQKGNPIELNSWIVDENEEFYLESRDPDGTDYYFKAKRKITDLIYDFNSNKMFYLDYAGQKHEADWFNNKFINSSIANRDISYEDVAKPNGVHYYIISPQDVTLKIKGTGHNKVFKFNNERYTDKKINIEFENLNLTNSELKFENVNSITLSGQNSITQNGNFNNLTALTYSLAPGASGVKWNNGASFIVHGADSNGYSQINYIIDSSNNSNVSITKLSFEDTVTSDQVFQFYPLSGSNSAKKFTTKTGYQQVSLLLPSDSANYILCDGNRTTCNPEDAYYYESNASGSAGNKISGPIGTRFMFTPNTPSNYYKVNNIPKVYVKVTQSGTNHYYITSTLEDAMQQWVSHTSGTHEVVFLGNYNINQDSDIQALQNHDKNTAGITFMTQVDDIKYILTVSQDLILEKYARNRAHLVTFDHMKWKSNSDDRVVYANGRSLTFGSDVEMVGSYAPSIMGGHPTNANLSSQNQSITIQSGIYKTVMGQHGNMTGDVTVTIENGTFNGQVIGAHESASGNLTLTIKNGTFSYQVYGAAQNATSIVTMMIENGTFNGQVTGASGSSRSPVTLTISGGTFAQEVSGASEDASGQVTMTISRGTFENEVIGATGKTTSTVDMTILDGIFNGTIRGSSDNSRSQVTLMIESGTFANEVIGSGWSASGQVTLTIKNGNFAGKVIGAGGSASGQVTLNIENGTFNSQVSGARNSASGQVTLTISGGTFAQEVSGASGNASSPVNMTISGGTFNEAVIGAADPSTGAVTMTISGGTFEKRVYGSYSSNSSSSDITVTITDGYFKANVTAAYHDANQVIFNISGGSFAANIAGTERTAPVDMTISGGTFTGKVYGNGSSYGDSTSVNLNINGGKFQSEVAGSIGNTKKININITNGTFASEVVGQDSKHSSNTVNINIDGQVSIPTIKGYDLLSIGGTTPQSILTVNNSITSTGVQDEKVKLQNQSTLQLTGSSSSSIKALEIDGTDNTLMLELNNQTPLLVVKNSYNFNNYKLNLNVSGNRANESVLIDFYNHKTNIDDFKFIDADYYIREINHSSDSGQNLVLYAKMDPTQITFKWDVSTNNLKYSFDGKNEEDVWWHSIPLNDAIVNFSEANLMMYKGTEIFKNPSKLTEIKLELSGLATNKDISISSVTTTPWNLKLNAVNLTNSKINATNLKQIELTGQNIIKSLNSSTPAFSYTFSSSAGGNKVIAPDDQSNLVVYSANSNGISVPTQGDIGQILSLSFNEVVNQDETVRLVDTNNKEIRYTIPSGTEKMSILFGNSSATRTYQLCHGTSSCTGSSLYVAGVNDATFKDSFEIQSNNQVADYQNVRRANPIKTINVSFPASVSFNIDLGTASSNVVDNTNWQQYFSSQPIEMINNNQSIKDVYTDQKGTIHHFGKTPTNLEVEYNGVEKGTGSTMELVSPSDLDTSSNGLKVALSLTDSNNTNSPIPLYENSSLSNQPWMVNPTDKLILEIKPYFDNNKNYFFRDYSTLTQYQANYKLKFKFNANP